jgi:uncharacterized membrane protein
MMDSLLQEWLDLVVRWIHVITAIAWIGSSFFFMWLDSHLEAPAAPRKGIEGELWMTHSGGFYRVEKIKVAPNEMPRTLHWFKWEAAFTWISGVTLLAIVYYLGSGLDFLDPSIAGLGSAGVSIAAFIALGTAWLVYDSLYMSPLARTPLAALIGFALLTATAYVLSQYMSGRAAYLHVGAIMGTIMAANVWLRIIPAQRELVAATKAGRALDPSLGLRAKQRSVHNNYMTLPVVFIMISNHFSSTYSHALNWLVLVGLALVGAGVRHYFNLRNRGENAWWIWPVAGAAMVALFFLVRE